MSNRERNQFSNPEAFNEREIAEHGREQHEKLKQERERAAEKSHEQDIESARREALDRASRVEKKEARSKTIEKSPAERRGPSKRDKKVSYDKAMSEARSHMSAPSRLFSSFIHAPGVERASEVIGSTVARPNAILSGALLAFLLTLGIYLVARMNGYQLSGSETMAAFAIGWVLGVIYDFMKTMITGKR